MSHPRNPRPDHFCIVGAPPGLDPDSRYFSDEPDVEPDTISGGNRALGVALVMLLYALTDDHASKIFPVCSRAESEGTRATLQICRAALDQLERELERETVRWWPRTPA